MIRTIILSNTTSMYGTIIIVMHNNMMLNNICIEALPMMNPSSITVVHAMHENVLVYKSLTEVLLIQTSTTWA
jgi:hypothetical protein